MSKENGFVIKMSEFGSHLGSRLHARDIFDKIRIDVAMSSKVILDFSGIKQVTLSFCTEIFDSLSSMDKDFDTVNENEFVKNVTDFCKRNPKDKKLETA